jgi:hypothetical protein
MSQLPDARLDHAGSIDPLLLEYDYFKHLSTIALVTIGAILTWVQGEEQFGKFNVMVGLTLVAISAVLGFGAMNHIISHRKGGKKLRWLFRWERGIASFAFAVGLGIFVGEIGRIAQ